jgi:hypothetical protein
VEKEMVDFFEKVESDMQVIYQMDDANDHINAYLYTYDLGKAMTIVKENKERNAQIEKARQKHLHHPRFKRHSHSLCSTKRMQH